MSSLLSAVLTITLIGLALAFVVSVVLVVVAPWADFGGNGTLGIPVALDIDSQALHVRARDFPAGTARLTNVTGTLQFTAPSKRTLVAPLLTLSVMLLMVLWVVHQLRRLLRALSAGRMFDPRNVRFVQRIGWAVIVAEPLRAGITYSANAYAASRFVADGIRFVWNIHVNLSAVFCGLVILVIAEVFRAGTKLDQDQSLTI